MSKNEVEIKKLEFISCGLSYERGENVFKDLTIEPPLNKVVRLHGSAGCGKSTILKIMAGLVAPTEGDYKINGESVLDMTFVDFIPYRLKIGYAFEMGGLLSNRTISENLKLPLQFHQLMSVEKIAERVDFLIELFSLKDVAKMRPSEVSGSRRKAAVVARALVNQPDLLLLDDPTTGLSDLNKKNLCQLIKENKEKGLLKHVFVVSDDKYFVNEVVEETLAINKTGILKAA